jgi:hypothetical protein
VRQLCEELSGDPKVFEYYVTALSKHNYNSLSDLSKVTTERLQQINIPEDIAYIIANRVYNAHLLEDVSRQLAELGHYTG